MGNNNQNRVFIVGVGCTAFSKPRGERETHEMALEAATKALLDAGVTYDDVQFAAAGYVYGDSTCGQRALYQLGMTGIPVVNVNNNCSTGSTALYLSASQILSGAADCALAVGFERMNPGSLRSNWPDREPPMVPWGVKMEEWKGGKSQGPAAATYFGNAALEYDRLHGSGPSHLAQIAEKNHAHSASNPYSQFRNTPSAEEILAARKITETLTLPMCSPTSDGAAAVIVASEDFVKQHALQNQAIELVAFTLATDGAETFESGSLQEIAGANMTRRAAKEVFEKAGASSEDVGVVELHDCFAANELITYDALGLCKPGEAHRMCERGDNTYGGKYVVNPSGGLEAKGHPLGATGLGMHFYITTQLRNWAGPMQAPGLFEKSERGKFGLVHNLGLGGAAYVGLLRRPEFYAEGGPDGRDRLGYNHAHELRGISMADVDKVKSRKKGSAWLTGLGTAKL